VFTMGASRPMGINKAIMSDDATVVMTNYQAYADSIRSVRTEVFVIEQSVPIELEHDEFDESATHVVVFSHGLAIATGRILVDGHIGRIAVLKEWRGKGFGKLIMEKFFERAKEQKLSSVWLSSQWHAHGFYCNLGFACIGEKYYEAGIEHIKMRKPI